MSFFNRAKKFGADLYASVKSKVSEFFQSKTTQVAATGTALMASAGAASADIGTDITAAFTAANGNVTLAAGGVIALVAIVTGIGLIVSLLRK